MATRSPWEPVQLGSGARLDNRFALAPMTTDSSHIDGTVSEDELRYLERRCTGHVAIALTSCAYVHPDGRSWQGIGARPEHAESLRRLAATVRRNGSLALLQLYDGGRIAIPGIIGPDRLRAPSAIASARPGAAVPRAMTDAEIRELIDAFTSSACTARESGFDGVELHGANHYLLQQFFSPRANRRDDHWGGTYEARTRFSFAIVDAIRGRVGRSFTLGFRLNPFETEPGGYELVDAARFAADLSERGIDYVHISMDDFRRNAPMREDRDWTQATTLPAGEPISAIADAVAGRCAVVASGGVWTATDATEALERGADLVAVGRAAVVEPDWFRKVANGEPTRRLLPATQRRIETELTIPSRMAAYLLSRPGWLPREEVAS